MNELLDELEKALDTLEYDYLQLLNKEQFQNHLCCAINAWMQEMLAHPKNSNHV